MSLLLHMIFCFWKKVAGALPCIPSCLLVMSVIAPRTRGMPTQDISVNCKENLWCIIRLGSQLYIWRITWSAGNHFHVSFPIDASLLLFWSWEYVSFWSLNSAISSSLYASTDIYLAISRWGQAMSDSTTTSIYVCNLPRVENAISKHCSQYIT